MKFASAKTIKGRSLTRERQRRDRAAMPALRVRFPKISTLKIEFVFRDRNPFTPAPQTTVLHPPATAYFVFPCPYMDCDGEFDLSEPVAGAAKTDEPCDGHVKCNGHRRLDAGPVPCELTLEYSIEASLT